MDDFRWKKELGAFDRALDPYGIDAFRDPYESLKRATGATFGHHDPLGTKGAIQAFFDAGQSGALAKLRDEQTLYRKLFEDPLDPMRQLRGTGYGLVEEAFRAQREHERAFAAFRLPHVDELTRLSREVAASTKGIGASLAAAALAEQMARMDDPWLRVGAETASARGFSEMLSIGKGLAERQPFSATFGASLRDVLGDWRDVPPPSIERMLDPSSRSAFYAERGFASELTDFSPPAFEAGLRIAGLRRTDPEPSEADDEADADAVRARDAFECLREFEIEMRAFIVRVMTEAFGDGWLRRRLPQGMLENWKAKRDAAIAIGQAEAPLIEYADFSEYYQIIERKDNWREVFAVLFRRPEDIRESLLRLSPIRVATMHARIVTQEDQMLMLVETRRVLKVIRK